MSSERCCKNRIEITKCTIVKQCDEGGCRSRSIRPLLSFFIAYDKIHVSNRQANRQTGKQAGKQVCKQADEQKLVKGQTGKQVSKQANR